ncbi:helix-turn-helix domain-containing protein [Cupriavidus sp. UME77]|uniref:helix-turn-helix domain-containing protein n=1 Tax=Cupriavidus sp. UME77 TaxID=1862321 RepID=UPI0016014AC4|nr:helix-turn-helix transcriptional regulator [Cupriavidus sp. UME77]
MALKNSITPKTAFGQRLRQLRLEAGLSQEALAALAKLDHTYVSSCERGHRNVSLETIYKFANALGIEAAVLLTAQHSNKT